MSLSRSSRRRIRQASESSLGWGKKGHSCSEVRGCFSKRFARLHYLMCRVKFPTLTRSAVPSHVSPFRVARNSGIGCLLYLGDCSF